MITFPQAFYIVFFRLCDLDDMPADRLCTTVDIFDQALSKLPTDSLAFTSPYGGGVLCTTVDDALFVTKNVISNLGASVVAGLTSGMITNVTIVGATTFVGHALNRAARLAYLGNMSGGQVVASWEFVRDAVNAKEALRENFFGSPRQGKVKRTSLKYHVIHNKDYIGSVNPLPPISTEGLRVEPMHILLFDLAKYSDMTETDMEKAVESLAKNVTKAHGFLGRGPIKDDDEIRFAPAGDGGALIFKASQAKLAWKMAEDLHRYALNDGIDLRMGLDSGQMVRRGDAVPLGPAVLTADQATQQANVGQICLTTRFLEHIPESDRYIIKSNSAVLLLDEIEKLKVLQDASIDPNRSTLMPVGSKRQDHPAPDEENILTLEHTTTSSPSAYTRDYVKTCTVRIMSEEGPPDRTGFLISPDGCLVTCSDSVGEKGDTHRVQLRGGARLYQPRKPLLDKGYCSATVLEKDIDIAVLKINEGVRTPYIILSADPIVECGDSFWSGFRWWVHRKDQQVMGEAQAKAYDDDYVTLDSKDFVSESRIIGTMVGAPLLHKKTGCVLGMILEALELNRTKAVSSRQISRLASRLAINTENNEAAFASLDTIGPGSPYCRLYSERLADEELRSYLLGEQAEYIRLIAPPRMGVDSLFKRFKFENVRFEFYSSRLLGPITTFKNLLWKTLRDISNQSGCPIPTRQPRDIENYFAEFVHRTVPEKVRDRIIVYHIDNIESIILDEEVLKTFLMFFQDLHNDQRPPYDQRVRFAVSGHIRTEAENGSLAKSPLMMAVRLRHFSEDESRELTNLLIMAGVPLSDEGHKTIYEWTGGHPFLLQYVFGKLIVNGVEDLSKITLEDFLRLCLIKNPGPELMGFVNEISSGLSRNRSSAARGAIERFRGLCSNPKQEEALVSSDDSIMRLYHLGVVRSENHAGYVKIGAIFFVEAFDAGLINLEERLSQ